MNDVQQTASSIEVPAESATAAAAVPRRIRPIPVTLALALVIGGGYVAYQRVGTTANADVIEFTQNYGDGFVALGFTEEQPGFVVLSALDEPLVEIANVVATNGLAGTHTVVRIQTPQDQWQKRLRGPLLVVIDKEGRVDSSPIEWSLEEFMAVRDGIDCNHEEGSKRCGAPFADLHALFAGWEKQRIPEKARRFLQPFADRHPGSDHKN